jgi:hypothetical protein
VLTTKNSREIEQNVVTDVNANLPEPEKAKQRNTLSPEAALLFNKSVVAKPLMTPEVCSVHIKRNEYRYRWVNKAGRNGAIYMQRRAQGFSNATSDDVDVLGGDAVSNNGEITAGDLILMKIPAERYDAAMKYNMERAHTLSRTRGMYYKGGSTNVMSDETATPVTIKSEVQGQGSEPFIPTSAEVDARIRQSFASGEVEKTRRTNDELRENARGKKE